MAVANLGSIATNVLLRIDNVPDSVSGNMLEIVDEQRLFMEEWTGLTIGSVGIAERFQPALTCFAMATTSEILSIQGTDAKSMKLGEFSVTKGEGSNVDKAAEYFRRQAMDKMKPLGRALKFKRVLS